MFWENIVFHSSVFVNTSKLPVRQNVYVYFIETLIIYKTIVKRICNFPNKNKRIDRICRLYFNFTREQIDLVQFYRPLSNTDVAIRF